MLQGFGILRRIGEDEMTESVSHHHSIDSPHVFLHLLLAAGSPAGRDELHNLHIVHLNDVDAPNQPGNTPVVGFFVHQLQRKRESTLGNVNFGGWNKTLTFTS
jgi:hypothetical protein